MNKRVAGFPRGKLLKLSWMLLSALIGITGCATANAESRAFGTTLPTLPTPPMSRGILSAWLRTEIAPEHHGTRETSGVSVYAPSGSLSGGVAARLSRYIEVRILVDGEFGGFGARGRSSLPMGVGRAGPGIVVGWSSDASPWSLQLTLDTPVSFVGWSGVDRCADCEMQTFFPVSDTRIVIEPRLALVGGLWITEWLHIFGQIGLVTRSRGTLTDSYVVDPLLATQVGAEAHLGSFSFLVEVQNVAFDPIFAWGPIFSASLRTTWGDGPGSEARQPSWRDAIEDETQSEPPRPNWRDAVEE